MAVGIFRIKHAEKLNPRNIDLNAVGRGLDDNGAVQRVEQARHVRGLLRDRRTSNLLHVDGGDALGMAGVHLVALAAVRAGKNHDRAGAKLGQAHSHRECRRAAEFLGVVSRIDAEHGHGGCRRPVRVWPDDDGPVALGQNGPVGWLPIDRRPRGITGPILKVARCDSHRRTGGHRRRWAWRLSN